ncbi:MAG: Crp/Fnr family transcriptional regulator [Deltaproteobacteria bacterium]|nr:Crp/Fnr family transcriptional regulator [Deltaproteobacteria bacterium]
MEADPRFPPDATETERTGWANTLANLRVFATASAKTTQQLIGAARFSRHAPGALLVRGTDPASQAYFLLTGIARVFQARADLQYTAKILTAPTHFGELAALGGLPHHQSSIEALTPGVTAAVPIALLEALLREDPELCRAWLYSVARQFSVTIDFLKQCIFGGVTARLANVLLSYADAFGCEQADGWWDVGYELSYAALAEQAACTRRAVIKCMKALTAEGVVRSEQGRWRLRRAALLDELLPARLSLTYSLDDNREPNE